MEEISVPAVDWAFHDAFRLKPLGGFIYQSEMEVVLTTKIIV